MVLQNEEKQTASSEFEALINMHHDANSIPVHPAGSSEMSQTEKDALQEWLAQNSSQELIKSSLKEGERRSFGIVLSVKDDGDGTSGSKIVSYLNEFGTRPTFLYKKEIYPEAPNGYTPGDVILMTYSKPGWTPDTVKPIRIPDDHRAALIKKIKLAYRSETK